MKIKMFVQYSHFFELQKKLAFKCCLNSFHYAIMIYIFDLSFINLFIHLKFYQTLTFFPKRDKYCKIAVTTGPLIIALQVTTFLLKYNRIYKI